MTAAVAAGTMGSGRREASNARAGNNQSFPKDTSGETSRHCRGKALAHSLLLGPTFLPATGCFPKYHQTPLGVEKYAESLWQVDR